MAQLDDPVEVAGTVAHELLHVALPGEGHRSKFARAARELGLEGKPTSTTVGEGLAAELKEITDRLGPYPHTPERVRIKPLPPTTTDYRFRLRHLRTRYAVDDYLGVDVDSFLTDWEVEHAANDVWTLVHDQRGVRESFDSRAGVLEFVEEYEELHETSDVEVPEGKRIAGISFPPGGITEPRDITKYSTADLKKVAEDLIRRATSEEAAALHKLFVKYAEKAAARSEVES